MGAYNNCNQLQLFDHAKTRVEENHDDITKTDVGYNHRRGYDRIPVKHEGTPEMGHMLMDYFGPNNHEQLLRVYR